ncbi:VOC family protein [Microbacterium sp. ARD31]|jgi:PhnB protein|uniref:VOC family protein n=1 Tax=unclassified Microbacterium TaxID=2609290 RepID=UPI00203B71B1|nr:MULTISPECIES: VOC family protein [unclassified Microbacterium]MDT0180473.1 VOC family protein [Microbacterium sp. ARD31]
MTDLTLYVWFPGNAAEALTFYRDVFDGRLELHTYEEFGRTDGPAEAIAHGILGGPVRLYGTDAAGDEPSVSQTGVSMALLGTADPETLTRWFDGLSDGGTVLDPMQKRPWGSTDGQVVDRFGIRWLIGYED